MALDDPGIGDPVLIEFLREIRVDPGRDELAEAVRFRLLQLAPEIIMRDPDLADLVLVEQGLETAVRDRRGLRALEIEALDKQHAEDGESDVPEIDVFLLVHGPAPGP